MQSEEERRSDIPLAFQTPDLPSAAGDDKKSELKNDPTKKGKLEHAASLELLNYSLELLNFKLTPTMTRDRIFTKVKSKER